MNPKIRMRASVQKESLTRKFSIAFIFMSLVPVSLLIFIIHILKITPVLEREFPYFRLTILLVVLLCLASFDLVRRSMISLSKFTKRASEIAEGDFSGRVHLKDTDEIGTLAGSFNKITAELEARISELEESKTLLQNILQKIGSAVTSASGMTHLLELIIESVIKGTESTSGAIVLLAEDSQTLRVSASHGFGEELKTLELKITEGLMGRVMRSKRPESVSNVSTNAAANVEFKHGLASSTIMLAPLVSKGSALGLIMVSDKKAKARFNKDDIALLNNVAAQTAIAIKNFQLNEDAEQTYLETITALAVAVEAKDSYSRGHLDRVAKYVKIIGQEMGLDDEMMRLLQHGATLHDVGKIGVRDDVLKKEGPLTEYETKEMREHAIIGVNIIKPIRNMAALCELVRHHQEFYDGTGYPDGLKGEAIPLSARILKVADAYDAMTTNRPYRKALSKAEAKRELQAKAGIEFDPHVAEAFLRAI